VTLERRAPALHRVVAVGVLALAALACGSGERSASAARSGSEPQRGGTLVVGSTVDVDAWNEYVSQQTFAINLLRRIYARLAQEQGDTREHPPSFQPLLAESWTFSDDRRALTFRLR
jgi:ABC-type transport system substrate-binding protein